MPLIHFQSVCTLRCLHRTNLSRYELVRYLPSWFPLATFKRRAEEVRALDTMALNETFNYVLKQMVINFELYRKLTQISYLLT